MGPFLSVESTIQSYRGSTRGPSGPKNKRLVHINFYNVCIRLKYLRNVKVLEYQVQGLKVILIESTLNISSALCNIIRRFQSANQAHNGDRGDTRPAASSSSEQLTPLNDTPVHVTFLPTHHSFQDLKIKVKTLKFPFLWASKLLHNFNNFFNMDKVLLVWFEGYFSH